MKYTWLAIPATLVATIPGLLVGGVAKFIYLAMIGPMIEGGVLNWISDGFFGRVITSIFPEAIHGAIGGAMGIFLAHKFIKQADYNVVAYCVTSLVIMFSLIAIGFASSPLASLDTLSLVSNTAGLILGLFSVASTLSSPSQSQRATSN